MEYMTVKEAAKKWNISERLIQKYCIAGRIAGAVKFGNSWAIPENSIKPSDPRKEKAIILMPLLNTAFEPGECKDTIKQMHQKKTHDIALAEYYYFSGQAEKAVKIAEKYIDNSDLGVSLSACLIYGYANLTTGNIVNSQLALSKVHENLKKLDEDTSTQYRAMAVFTASMAAVLLHLPLPEGMPAMEDNIRFLPPGLRFFALYIQAHYAYLQEEYGKSIGIVETALSMQESVYPIPNIYLHLVATMAYMGMKQPDKAKEHLIKAWELAGPDDLIEGFGEHHGLLGGLIEVVIKKDYPEDFKRIISITYKFAAGWRKIHNPEAGREVADNLTTSEFSVAMLAARGWTNQEISQHMGISENTVKRYISTIFQKLHITQRKELKKHMLY